MIVVSGIQPTGNLHLGNYFGAIKPHIELTENKNAEAYYFIANYHALTTLQNAKLLEDYTYQIAAAYLALGLDLDKAVLFKQSDVPEVTELAWILSTITGMGVMNRCHAFKEKVEKGLQSSVGLFTYPILMAADILIYGADVVPVGGDQVQHVEVAKDLAASFNSAYQKEVFKLPRSLVSQATKVPGIDGQKMSKSYQNTIPIFAELGEWKKRISSIKTDSIDYKTTPLSTENETVFTLYSLMASTAEKIQMNNDYLYNYYFGYGHAKEKLLLKLQDYFGEATTKYQTHLKDKSNLDDILFSGAQRARHKAQETMAKVRETTGL